MSIRLGFHVFVVAIAALTLGAAATEARPLAELAPAGACGESLDAGNREAAVLCFVNWARRAHGLEPVARSASLTRAATEKARTIVRCAQFSHTPCGVPSTAAVVGTGYRYRMWGETLYSADGTADAPRAAVRAWLASPPHRRALLEPIFRDAGCVQVVHDDPDFSGPAGVWVLELGRR